MDVPGDLRYSAEHEWVRVTASGTIRVGITDYAQDALGDVVFIEMPGVGTTVTAGATCGEIESTKSVSEVYTPLSGTITAVNEALADDPAVLNTDPYGAGWIFEITPSDPSAADALMDADSYRALTEG
ncbi:MAG: glycine cleavage system protein GcvH [Ilumatobacteraceae bacterium]|jgi:glycine cleavage system H protein